jgi:integrator complex subunit 1
VHSSTTVAVHENDDGDASDREAASPNSDRRKRKLDRTTVSKNSFDDEKIEKVNQGTVDQSRSAATEVDEKGATTGNIVLHKYRYPVKQHYLKLERVRHRYYGKNRTAAHNAILMSLTKRLNTKSKQNSGLLQCLPSFMEISGVRKLVAARLEKWLQSPALAGLARSLFTCIVQRIKIVDPPLDDDLHVINSIVEMNLKSNQVRIDYVNDT